MNANKALGAQATLERRDRLIDQVGSLGADGVAKIGARLKVADVLVDRIKVIRIGGKLGKRRHKHNHRRRL